MGEMLMLTGLGGRRAEEAKRTSVEDLGRSLGLSGREADAWTVVERSLRKLEVAQGQAGLDVLSVVETSVVEMSRRLVEEVRDAVETLRSSLSPEQLRTLADRSCEVRQLDFARG